MFKLLDGITFSKACQSLKITGIELHVIAWFCTTDNLYCCMTDKQGSLYLEYSLHLDIRLWVNSKSIRLSQWPDYESSALIQYTKSSPVLNYLHSQSSFYKLAFKLYFNRHWFSLASNEFKIFMVFYASGHFSQHNSATIALPKILYHIDSISGKMLIRFSILWPLRCCLSLYRVELNTTCGEVE